MALITTCLTPRTCSLSLRPLSFSHTHFLLNLTFFYLLLSCVVVFCCSISKFLVLISNKPEQQQQHSRHVYMCGACVCVCALICHRLRSLTIRVHLKSLRLSLSLLVKAHTNSNNIYALQENNNEEDNNKTCAHVALPPIVCCCCFFRWSVLLSH